MQLNEFFHDMLVYFSYGLHLFFFGWPFFRVMGDISNIILFYQPF